MVSTIQFIFEIVAIVSLGVIVYVVSRAIPRVPETEDNLPEFHMFDRVVARMPLQKFDAMLERTIKKFLRKIKVNLMRVDHMIGARLQKGEQASSASPSTSDRLSRDGNRGESLKQENGENNISKLQ